MDLWLKIPYFDDQELNFLSWNTYLYRCECELCNLRNIRIYEYAILLQKYKPMLCLDITELISEFSIRNIFRDVVNVYVIQRNVHVCAEIVSIPIHKIILIHIHKIIIWMIVTIIVMDMMINIQ